jgi:hypothetical protein
MPQTCCYQAGKLSWGVSRGARAKKKPPQAGQGPAEALNGSQH